MEWQGLLGIVALPALAWAMGENRRRVRWRLVAVALALQVGLALMLLRIPPLRAALQGINDWVVALQTATREGTAFVFGYLGGGPPPFAITEPAHAFVLAFQALPILLLMSALSALLFHWRILPWLVKGCSVVLERTLRIGGAVGVAAAANVFFGMVEAALMIRPYVAKLGRGELFMVMTCGMATIAGTMFVLYATMLAPVLPDAAGQLLVASVISAPAALMISELMLPAGGDGTSAEVLTAPSHEGGAIEAVLAGTSAGVTLLIDIVALLLVLVALVSLADAILALLPEVAGKPVSLQGLVAWPMRPIAWLIGVPWSEVPAAAHLLATKVVLNELVAYAELAALPADALSPHSKLIVIYALCGFANIASAGIMIGGMAAMAPERRPEIARLGLRSIISGLLATCLTGAVVGLLA